MPHASQKNEIDREAAVQGGWHEKRTSEQDQLLRLRAKVVKDF